MVTVLLETTRYTDLFMSPVLSLSQSLSLLMPVHRARVTVRIIAFHRTCQFFNAWFPSEGLRTHDMRPIYDPEISKDRVSSRIRSSSFVASAWMFSARHLALVYRCSSCRKHIDAQQNGKRRGTTETRACPLRHTYLTQPGDLGR